MIKYKILTINDDEYEEHMETIINFSIEYMPLIYKEKSVVDKTRLLTYKMLLLLVREYYNDFDMQMPLIATLSNDKNKKPYFIDNHLYFNVSHTKDGVAAIISKTECGIDIEYNRDIDLRIANKCCNEFDNIYLGMADDKNQMLLKIWNVKESVSKLIGTGFAVGFKNINFNLLANKAHVNEIKDIHIKQIEKENYFITISSFESIEDSNFTKTQNTIHQKSSIHIL